jgi:hypothetical protein
MLKARFFTLILAGTFLACRASGDNDAEPTAPTEPLVPGVLEADDSDLLSPDLFMAPSRVHVETYDGSGEIVHPDALVFPHGWRGHRYWFAATPYPLGNSTLENPSGFAGDSAQDWRTIPGLTNPIAMPASSSYLSDPDLSYDPALDRMRLYYRQTTASVDQIYLRTSSTGSEWSEPTLVAQDARYSLISPAIVREPNGSWRMWTVNAGAAGCRAHAADLTLTQRRSRDGISWNSAEAVQLAINRYVPWHWDVQYIRDRQEYWALIAAYPDGTTCSRTSIFFARSANGTAWTVSPTPLLEPGALPALNDLVYRSTFRYYPSINVVRVWFSGASVDNGKFHYALAIGRYPLAELLRRVDGASLSLGGSALRSHEPHNASLHAAREQFVNAFP